MTTELEQEFYDTFRIEKQKYYACKNKDYNDVFEVKYPEITDRKLLEMICIFSQHCNFGRWNKYAMHSIDDFKYIMLSQLIEYQKKTIYIRY